MVTLPANQVGYINKSGGVYIDKNTNDIYLRNRDGSYFIGVLEFTTSINDLLGTKAKTWNELYFSEAFITVKNRSSVPLTGYKFAIGSTTSIGQNFIFSGISASKDNCAISTDGLEESISQIHFKELFSLISSEDDSFTPNTSTWYFFIYHPNLEYRNNYFYRLGSYGYTSFLTINGMITSNIHYYYENSWKRCIPYYYNGTNWVQCQANYYDGNSWIKT